jgi:hypothetical protein
MKFSLVVHRVVRFFGARCLFLYYVQYLFICGPSNISHKDNVAILLEKVGLVTAPLFVLARESCSHFDW